MTEEKELEAWRAEWQSLGGREELARELVTRSRKGSTRLKRTLAVEVGASILTNAFFLRMAIASHGAPVMLVLCAGAFFFSGIWLTWLFTTFDTKANAASVDAYVELLRRRLDNDARRNAFSRRTTIALGFAIVPWSIWKLIVDWDLYRAEPWRFVVGLGGVAIILAGMLVATAKRRATIAAERERFESFVAERLLA